MNIHHHCWCKFRLKIRVSKGPSPTKVRDPINFKQFLEETKNHLEWEGDVAGLVDPVDVVVVEAGNSLPFFIFVQHILREFSTPAHVIWKMWQCFDLTLSCSPMFCPGRWCRHQRWDPQARLRQRTWDTFLCSGPTFLPDFKCLNSCKRRTVKKYPEHQTNPPKTSHQYNDAQFTLSFLLLLLSTYSILHSQWKKLLLLLMVSHEIRHCFNF